MSIKTKVYCDICDDIIIENTVPSITVVGNIHTVDSSDENGVGGGLFFGGSEPPTHNFHVNCLSEHMTNINKR